MFPKISSESPNPLFETEHYAVFVVETPACTPAGDFVDAFTVFRYWVVNKQTSVWEYCPVVTPPIYSLAVQACKELEKLYEATSNDEPLDSLVKINPSLIN